MAMVYVPPDCVADGTVLAVEVNGRACRAIVRSTPAYDPDGSRMRA